MVEFWEREKGSLLGATKHKSDLRKMFMARLKEQNKSKTEVKMETKSRYEVMSDLEERKAELINEQAGIGLTESRLNREIEKAKERLEEFVEGKEIKEQNIKDQIESIEKSLGRLNSQKK